MEISRNCSEILRQLLQRVRFDSHRITSARDCVRPALVMLDSFVRHMGTFANRSCPRFLIGFQERNAGLFVWLGPCTVPTHVMQFLSQEILWSEVLSLRSTLESLEGYFAYSCIQCT